MTNRRQFDLVTRRSLILRGSALGAATLLPVMQSKKMFGSPTASSEDHASITASATQNVVETDSGKIYGYARAGVVGYRGIAYGASTAGDRRFMSPAKPAPWTGTRSALYWGWASPSGQNATSIGRRKSWEHDDEAFMFQWDDGQPSEDCLRLNVWTPKTDNVKRAVMFWIHGGGMSFGSDNELRAYDGENLAREQDVVVVSINHRLNVFGFLNLMEYGEQYEDSANASMLDIIAALKWVRINISNFGGDPDRVMIFGQSGGGSKVATIMGMQQAKGLFHRASVQSGSGLRQSTVDTSAKLAHATLAELGVTKATLKRLHTDFTFWQLAEAGFIAQQKASGGIGPIIPGEPSMNWAPIVDGRLILSNVWDPAAPEASSDVPFMVGTTMNEEFNSVQMGDRALEGMEMRDAKNRLSRMMGAHVEQITNITLKLYPKATPFEVFSRASAMRLRMNAYRQAELKTRQGGAPAYLYRFDWQSTICDGRARAYHTSELPFCFNNAARCANLTGNTAEAHDLASRMAGAWAAFAKTGNPNSPGIPKWSAFNEKRPTMIFDRQCTASDDPDGELRRAVEDSIT